MHRITGDGYALDGTKRIFADEDLPTRNATQVTHQWANAVQEELATIVEDAGGTLQTDSEAISAMHQVNDAIKSRITAAVGGETTNRTNADLALTDRLDNHDHDGVDSSKIDPNNENGLTIGEFVLCFTGLATPNYPAKFAYRKSTRKWHGTSHVGDVVELAIPPILNTVSDNTFATEGTQCIALTASADLSAGNGTVITINGESTASIPFSTNHATTMANISAAVEALTGVAFSWYDATNRIIYAAAHSGAVVGSGTTTGGTGVSWALTTPEPTIPSTIRPSEIHACPVSIAQGTYPSMAYYSGGAIITDSGKLLFTILKDVGGGSAYDPTGFFAINQRLVNPQIISWR